MAPVGASPSGNGWSQVDIRPWDGERFGALLPRTLMGTAWDPPGRRWSEERRAECSPRGRPFYRETECSAGESGAQLWMLPGERPLSPASDAGLPSPCNTLRFGVRCLSTQSTSQISAPCPSIDHLQLSSVYGLELGFVPFPQGQSARGSCWLGPIATEPGVVNQRATSAGIFQLFPD